MLVIQLTMMEGRSDEQCDAVHGCLADAAASELGWDRDDVRTIVYEVPKRHWGIGGESVAARQERS